VGFRKERVETAFILGISPFLRLVVAGEYQMSGITIIAHSQQKALQSTYVEISAL
jgi:hypothetical protein